MWSASGNSPIRLHNDGHSKPRSLSPAIRGGEPIARPGPGDAVAAAGSCYMQALAGVAREKEKPQQSCGCALRPCGTGTCLLVVFILVDALADAVLAMIQLALFGLG